MMSDANKSISLEGATNHGAADGLLVFYYEQPMLPRDEARSSVPVRFHYLVIMRSLTSLRNPAQLFMGQEGATPPPPPLLSTFHAAAAAALAARNRHFAPSAFEERLKAAKEEQERIARSGNVSGNGVF